MPFSRAEVELCCEERKKVFSGRSEESGRFDHFCGQSELIGSASPFASFSVILFSGFGLDMN